jgi:hypothetical protein
MPATRRRFGISVLRSEGIPGSICETMFFGARQNVPTLRVLTLSLVATNASIGLVFDKAFDANLALYHPHNSKHFPI